MKPKCTVCLWYGPRNCEQPDNWNFSQRFTPWLGIRIFGRELRMRRCHSTATRFRAIWGCTEDTCGARCECAISLPWARCRGRGESSVYANMRTMCPMESSSSGSTQIDSSACHTEVPDSISGRGEFLFGRRSTSVCRRSCDKLSHGNASLWRCLTLRPACCIPYIRWTSDAPSLRAAQIQSVRHLRRK